MTWTAFILVFALFLLQWISHQIHSRARENYRFLRAAHALLFLSPILWGIFLLLSFWYVPGKNLQFATIAVSCYGLAIIAGLRYMALRLKRTQIAYELLVVLVDSRLDVESKEKTFAGTLDGSA
jgi:hypothetical protein